MGAFLLLATASAVEAQNVARDQMRYRDAQQACRARFQSRIERPRNACIGQCRVRAEAARDRCLAAAETRYRRALRHALRPYNQ